MLEQVLVRWALQHGTSVIPKASSESHMRSNLDVLNWPLPEDDFKALSSLKFQVGHCGLPVQWAAMTMPRQEVR
jgi:diketogulonate reductase-like aldo/keto reductase